MQRGITSQHLKNFFSSSAGDNGFHLLEANTRLIHCLPSCRLNLAFYPHMYGTSLCRSHRLKRRSGGARRRRRRPPPTASRLEGPRKQKRFAYKLLKRGLAKRFAYKLLKRGLANLMSPTSTSGVAPPLIKTPARLYRPR
ncbi:hypothetical protein EVAR_33345_1 [Eumeta japonica]|uniref:Uncharacterized protein n=1 Tax=Eumeta variegata TaxID=151549 RepID=A0A4C1YNR8_EUMVA|nr:hypothetical protein EVAR_33345_1 [Eumeta japonica]